MYVQNLRSESMLGLTRAPRDSEAKNLPQRQRTLFHPLSASGYRRPAGSRRSTCPGRRPDQPVGLYHHRLMHALEAASELLTVSMGNVQLPLGRERVNSQPIPPLVLQTQKLDVVQVEPGAELTQAVAVRVEVAVVRRAGRPARLNSTPK